MFSRLERDFEYLFWIQLESLACFLPRVTSRGFSCDYVMYWAPVAGDPRLLKGDSIVVGSLQLPSVHDEMTSIGCQTALKSVYFGYLVLGLASGLEAFSRKPPCDSFGALAVRQTP